MSTKIKKLNENIHPSNNSIVQVKKMGCVTEVRYMTTESKILIKKLDTDNYLNLKTGEILSIMHKDKRIDNKNSVTQSLRNLRDLLNTNITDTNYCLWLTLTYAENMTDSKRLYDDFRKFNQRMRYYHKKNYLPNYEYIATAEPQARGAWHLHVLMIYLNKPPYIPNDVLNSIWKSGFTKIKKLTEVNNVGLYLTAYLSDMELTETLDSGLKVNKTIKEVKTCNSDGKELKKAIIKGQRLKLYPAGFRIFRVSNGIKRPEILKCTEAEAMKLVDDASLTFEKTVQVLGEDNTGYNIINYRHYNSKVQKEADITNINRKRSDSLN